MKNNTSSYTVEQIEWLKENFKYFEKFSPLTKAFNEHFDSDKTEVSLKTKVSRLGLKLRKDLYTAEQDEWIVNNYSSFCTVKEALQEFNNTFSTNKSKNSLWSRASRLNAHQREVHNYTEEEDQWIKENFHKDTWENLAVEFNEIFNSNIIGDKIRQRVSSLGLKRENPHVVITNKKYSVGDEVKKGKYIRVKIKEYERGSGWNDKKANECWTTKQRVIWEKHYGKSVPDDCQIIFLNNDSNDFSIDNLYCIKKQYLSYMRANNWFSSNPEFTLTAIKWCELMYATRE